MVRDPRAHARVHSEELLHAVTVSGQDHHQALALVLHHLQQYLDRLNPVVALVLGAIEVVGLVDEEHPAVGALDHLLGLGRGVPDVLAHEVVAGHGHHVIALDVSEPVEDLSGAQRHCRFACPRVAGEAHVEGRPGGGEAGLAAQLVHHEQRADLAQPALDRRQRHELAVELVEHRLDVVGGRDRVRGRALQHAHRAGASR